MANVEIKLDSGALLQITTSSLDDCDALMSALAVCFKGIPLSADVLNQDISNLKDFFAEAIASPAVKTALWKCCARATYDGVKVTKTLFDDPEKGDAARGDYFEIVLNVIKVNCAPFFVPIFSKWKARFQSVAGSPKPA